MKIIKIIILSGLFLMLFAPHIQKIYNFPKLKPLQGYTVLSEKPKFKLKTWMTGSFQDSLSNYINENIGFRPFFIRINNQISFNISKIALANGVIVGKDNYLYEVAYITAYLGRDFIGKEKIDDLLMKAVYVQNELKKRNVILIFVLAPGKASFYPEYIPDRYHPEIKSITNYEYFSARTKELGINHIDFRKYFIEMKNKAKYPLYPKLGIHWSTYGAFLAADSLIKYMEKIKNIKMAGFNIMDIELTNKPKGFDNDIANGMNLLFDISHPDLAYPIYNFTQDSDDVKPSVLIVGDSYYNHFQQAGVQSNIFGACSFWFYNRKEDFSSTTKKNKFDSQLELKEEIENRDFIILLYNEVNIRSFSDSLIENIYSLYHQ